MLETFTEGGGRGIARYFLRLSVGPQETAQNRELASHLAQGPAGEKDQQETSENHMKTPFDHIPSIPRMCL